MSSRRVSIYSVALLVTGLLSLAGTLLNIRVLASFWPGATPTQPITAACMVGMAIAIVLLESEAPANRLIAGLFGLALVAFSCVRAIAGPFLRPAVAHLPSLGLVAVGLSGLSIAASAVRWKGLSRISALTVGVIALFSLSGYAFTIFPNSSDVLSVSIPGTLAFFAMAGALLFEPESELAIALSSSAPSGRFARLLLPFTLFLPLLIGLLATTAEESGIVRSVAVPSLQVALTGLLLAAITWLAVAQQRAREAEAEGLTRSLEDKVRHLRLLHAVTSDPQLNFEEKSLSILRQLAETVHADGVFLMALEGERLTSKVSAGMLAVDKEPLDLEASCGVCTQTLMHEGPVVFLPADAALRESGIEIDGHQAIECLAHRIMSESRPYGIIIAINASERADPFSPDDMDQMRLVARWLEFEMNDENAKRALRESEEQFKNLAETMPGMVFQFERDSMGYPEFTYVSSGSRQVFDADPAQLLADPHLIEKLSKDTELRDMVDRMNEAESESKLYHRLRTMTLPSGEHRWVETYAQPRRLESGKNIWTGISMDVTEQRRLARELDRTRERLAAIVSSVEDVIFSTTADGSQTTFVSEASRRMLGHSSADYLRNPNLFFERVHPEDRSALMSDFQQISSDCPIDREVRYQHPDGRTLWLRVRAHLVVSPGGSPLRVDGITTDVTRRRQMEDEAERARKEAVAANAAKSEFLSRMSHELRTPMNAILGFAQLLEMNELTERQSDAVQHILRAGRHLLQLVNEVLDLSRIESGTLAISLEPVELDRLVAESITLLRPLAAGRTIAVRHESRLEHKLHVMADGQRLRQVFLNLVSNAIKYSPVGGEVVVREIQRDGRAIVEVEDHGPGLTPAQIVRLFTPFDRLGAETSGIEGTGLGLPLAKRLLESMGGSLGVRSVPGQGSMFWADLRLASSQAVKDDDPLEPVELYLAPDDAQEVLLVEDNLSNVRLIEEIVRSIPQTSLVSAMQGRLGLELAREHPPALILLDIHLPDVNGLELLTQIRAEKPLADIPVIILSADATEGQIKRAMEAGADDYLTKPINVRQFINMLNKHMDRRVPGV